MQLLKLKINKFTVLLGLIFIFAFIVRFYNFPDRVTFWSEQARSLIVSSEYLKKPSLLGQEYFRNDSFGHIIYAGALFNYVLTFLIILTKGDPIGITAFFTLLNIVTGWVVYKVVKKIFKNIYIAFFSTILFLFNSYMIYHSLFFWIYNPLPLIGILIFYFLYKRNALLLGLLSGIGFSFQILFIPTALLVFIILLVRSKKKWQDSLLFLSGAILGNLPMVLFDIRHKFYETKTLFQFFLDTIHGTSGATFNYYYFLTFWPIFAIVGALMIYWIWKKSKLLAIIILVIYLFLNLSSKNINWKAPTGMPDGINTHDVDIASKAIAADAKGQFNVSEVLDFDKRAYIFRYFVQYKYGKAPMDELSYTNLPVLYVLAHVGFNFAKSDIWEITAGGPYKVSLLSRAGEGYAIYKLQK